MKRKSIKRLRSVAFTVQLFAFLLVSGYCLNAQQPATLSLSNSGEHTSVEPQLLRSMMSQLDNKVFKFPAQAETDLLNKFQEISDEALSGSLAESQQVYLDLSQTFNKHLYVDIKGGKTVRSALEDNIVNLINAYNNSNAANFGIEPIEVFTESVNLLSR